uniref:Uncharacterized protein n=1 Tax=Lactuca sativa TaxID=4236 RepID=A0A9R1UFJ6_LACSA|nr:hypothetical protein LSAT_V11C900497950 [Lactuca sativa]
MYFIVLFHIISPDYMEVAIMGKDDVGSSEVKVTTLHPTHIVTNIQTKIRTLDGTNVIYSSWKKFVWRLEIDALVLQWVYNTLSNELMVRILESDTTTIDARNKLKAKFINNKGSSVAALEQEFSNLNLVAFSPMEAYCRKLKDLANLLGDVDNPAAEARLILQMVRRLPPEFDITGEYINQSSPSWQMARSIWNNTEKPLYKIKLTLFLLLLLQSIDHHQTLSLVNMVKLPSITTIRAVAVDVQFFADMTEVSRDVEVMATKNGTKEINEINKVGTTHNHEICCPHHTLLMD